VQSVNSMGMRRGVLWSLALLFVIVALALGVFNVIALPGCRSCHVRAAFRSATLAQPHARVDCRSCHVPADSVGRIAFALREPIHMFVPIARGDVRDAAAVPDSRCLTCHKDVQDATVVSDGIRISHKSCAARASCSYCHSAVAHGTATSWVRAYDMDSCLACHVSEAQTDCDLCHEGRGTQNRIKSSTFAVTHGRAWRTTHGMGDVATCTVCHKSDDCVECHGSGVPHTGDFVKVHAAYAARKDARCTACHAASFCDSCHGTPMPHTRTFTAGHVKTAAADSALCKRCHADSDCTTCHTKHAHPGGAIGALRSTAGGAR